MNEIQRKSFHTKLCNLEKILSRVIDDVEDGRELKTGAWYCRVRHIEAKARELSDQLLERKAVEERP